MHSDFEFVIDTLHDNYVSLIQLREGSDPEIEFARTMLERRCRHFSLIASVMISGNQDQANDQAN